MKKAVHLLIIILLFALTRAGLFAAPEPVEKPVRYVDLEVTADKLTWTQPNERAMLNGNVILVHGDTVLKAEKVDYDKKGQKASANGSPRVTSPQNELTGDSIEMDLSRKIAVIKGNVKVLAKPKEAKTADGDSKKTLKTQLKEPVTLTCDVVEYYYKEKRIVASGNLKINQKDRNATAEKAVYTQKDEIAVLTGNVHVTDAKGQTFDSPKVTLSLKDDNDWVEAEKVKAVFKIKEEEEEAPTEAKTAPASAPTTTPTPAPSTP